jgi:hypothetical protein
VWTTVVLAALLTLGTGPAAAGQDSTGDRLDSVLDQMEREQAARESVAPRATIPSPLEVARLGDSASAARYLSEWTDYHIWGLAHRRDVFRWQLYSSRVIFYAVLFLVVVGVGFSGVQFYRAMRLLGGRRGAGGGSGAAAESTTSQLELSAGRIKVSSPVLGVIILVISLAFFYLYLVYVYPIQETVW